MRTAIVWFRRDLRVHDHPALTAAHREADRIVPVFVLDLRLLDAGRFPSANRAWFLLASLRELRAALRDRGGELFVCRGRPEAVLPELARQTGAEAVYFASDVSPFASARDRRVEAALGDVAVRRTPGNFVADVGQPQTADGRPFAVFSPFWRAWEQLPRRAVHGAPRSLTTPSSLEVGAIPEGPEPEAAEPFPPGEAAARRRLQRWLDGGIERYADRHDRLMRHLLCGDEAQNNGNWQWITSIGVDPAPYFRRLYNPMAQQERHDPDGKYVRRWCPELRDVPLQKLAAPWTMSADEQRAAGCAIGPDYPVPIVEHKHERERAIARYRAVAGR